jgi:hypothetical protein
MTTKNGFEIRLEVLKMAKEMMEQQYSEASNAYWNAVYSTAEKWNTSVSEAITKAGTVAPVMYTPAQIMEKASELYSFVSKRD